MCAPHHKQYKYINKKLSEEEYVMRDYIKQLTEEELTMLLQRWRRVYVDVWGEGMDKGLFAVITQIIGNKKCTDSMCLLSIEEKRKVVEVMIQTDGKRGFRSNDSEAILKFLLQREKLYRGQLSS